MDDENEAIQLIAAAATTTIIIIITYKAISSGVIKFSARAAWRTIHQPLVELIPASIFRHCYQLWSLLMHNNLYLVTS